MSEAIRSSKDRPPRVGDICTMGRDGFRWKVRNLDTRDDRGDFQVIAVRHERSGVGLLMRIDWDAGHWWIHEEGPSLPAPCGVEWCGMAFTDEAVPCGKMGEAPGQETEPPFTFADYLTDNRAFCSRECRARSAKPAAPSVPFKSSKERPPRIGDRIRCRGREMTVTGLYGRDDLGCNSFKNTIGHSQWVDGCVEILAEGPLPAKPAAVASEGRRLSEGWVPKAQSKFPHWYCDGDAHTGRCIPADYMKDGWGMAACSACAAELRVFADSLAAAPVPVAPPKPTPAPSPCTFACSSIFGTHGPKCARYIRPEALRAAKENAATVRARMGIVGKYEDTMTPSLSRSYREWAAAQRGIEPDDQPKPRVRVRDIYRSDDWRDAEWLPNREVGR